MDGCGGEQIKVNQYFWLDKGQIPSMSLRASSRSILPHGPRYPLAASIPGEIEVKSINYLTSCHSIIVIIILVILQIVI